MEISGPCLDKVKKRRHEPSCWFLRYTTPKLKPDGTSVLDSEGRQCGSDTAPTIPPRLRQWNIAPAKFPVSRNASLSFALPRRSGIAEIGGVILPFWGSWLRGHPASRSVRANLVRRNDSRSHDVGAGRR